MPLSQPECDSLLPKYLGDGVINLTDGASPYEALAGGGVRCSHPCDRNDCLKRARAEGRAQCGGWRLIKHGTQVADGAWAHVKRAGPQGIKSSQHDRIAEYVNAWAWKARRTGDYFFQVLAREPAP